jgi:hypothetical protein
VEGRLKRTHLGGFLPRRSLKNASSKAVVFRAACRPVVQGSASFSPGKRGKRVLQMCLAPLTSLGHGAGFHTA